MPSLMRKRQNSTFQLHAVWGAALKKTQDDGIQVKILNDLVKIIEK